MKLTVIIPSYNEASTVGQVLEKLMQQKEVAEVVVVNDASIDETANILSRYSKNKRIMIVNHEQNKGKGAAIQTGLEKATGDYVLVQDADLEYDPQDISLLTAPIINGKAEIVYGSRFTGPRKNMFFWHMVGNQLLSLLVNMLFNTTLSDMETCYKLLPTQLMRQLQLKARDFAIEPEITCKILKRGHFIYEVPISYNGRTFAEGKKITWKDGFKALYTILKLRFFS